MMVTSIQLKTYFRLTLQLTQYYRSIELVAVLGDGTIYLLAGEEIEILISTDGVWKYE
jgi:hypothetical protein